MWQQPFLFRFERWDDAVPRVRRFLKDGADTTPETEFRLIREVNGAVWSIWVILSWLLFPRFFVHLLCQLHGLSMAVPSHETSAQEESSTRKLRLTWRARLSSRQQRTKRHCSAAPNRLDRESTSQNLVN